MGPENNTRTGTLYINGEPIAEVISIQEIKIPMDVLQGQSEGADIPDFSLLKINFQENAPRQNTSAVVVGTDAEQMFLIYL